MTFGSSGEGDVYMAMRKIGGNELSLEKIRDAQITVVEFCLKKEIERTEMSDLIDMITPTHLTPVTDVSFLGGQ